MKLVNVLRAATIAIVSATAAAALAQPDKPAPAPPPPPLGPELWRGARIGMAQTDIAARFPAATASKGELLPSGARSALTLPTKIAGAPANAQFYFDADGLASIIINRPDVVAGKTAANLVKARGVVEAVAAEEGKPGNCIEQPRITALTCTWSQGEAKAVVSYRDVGGAAPTLNVSYRRLSDKKPWQPGPVRKLKPR